ncbi:MAG TPA: hypothetical protein VFW65_05655 [Pseudonocardiaceae bacterium]|nr:hypothetical protein [Pseudonocardiaceae bacterium]
MNNAVVVRYQMKADTAQENLRLVQQVYAELAETRPDGLRYATFLLDDGLTFIHIAITDQDENPLMKSAAFHEFQREFADRVAAPQVRSEATVAGSYGF